MGHPGLEKVSLTNGMFRHGVFGQCASFVVGREPQTFDECKYTCRARQHQFTRKWKKDATFDVNPYPTIPVRRPQ
jgi:hypothetical protein